MVSKTNDGTDLGIALFFKKKHVDFIEAGMK